MHYSGLILNGNVTMHIKAARITYSCVYRKVQKRAIEEIKCQCCMEEVSVICVDQCSDCHMDVWLTHYDGHWHSPIKTVNTVIKT